MHFENHMHQFAVYLKTKKIDFSDSFLQPFNYPKSTKDAPTANSAAKSKEEPEFEKEPPLVEEEKEEKENQHEEIEEEHSTEEESSVENDEAPPVVPSKLIKKHIIKANDEETED